MKQITQKEWDARWWKAFRALRKSRPDLDLEWARRNATRSTTVELGPRPPSMTVLAIKAGVSYLSGGGKVLWGKVAWKTLRPILGGAALLALYAGAEALLNATDTSVELRQLGAPAVLIPVLLGLGAGARNWLKHRKPAPAE